MLAVTLKRSRLWITHMRRRALRVTLISFRDSLGAMGLVRVVITSGVTMRKSMKTVGATEVRSL